MTKARDSHTSTRYAVIYDDTVIATFNTRSTAMVHKTMVEMLLKDKITLEVGVMK